MADPTSISVVDSIMENDGLLKSPTQPVVFPGSNIQGA